MKPQELDKLNVFIGKWHAEGTSFGENQDIANPLASAVPWVSEESYEWLPGNFFVLHKWDAKLGGHPFIGTEILGYDGAKKEFFAYLFIMLVFTRFTGQLWWVMSGVFRSQLQKQASRLMMPTP